MSILQNGRLVCTDHPGDRLGDELFLMRTLIDQPGKLPVTGRAVWVTPKGAQGNRQSGIGVEFSGEDVAVVA